MEPIRDFINIVLSLNGHLNAVIQSYGALTYLILFLIAFCETGLVIVHFLPGDSLIFATGALAATNTLRIE